MEFNTPCVLKNISVFFGYLKEVSRFIEIYACGGCSFIFKRKNYEIIHSAGYLLRSQQLRGSSAPILEHSGA